MAATSKAGSTRMQTGAASAATNKEGLGPVADAGANARDAKEPTRSLSPPRVSAYGLPAGAESPCPPLQHRHCYLPPLPLPLPAA